MIDTDKHDWDNQPLAHEVPYWMRHMYDNSLMIIARKEAEVKRLREAIADIATNMEAADASYMGGFIEDLWKVIE